MSLFSVEHKYTVPSPINGLDYGKLVVEEHRCADDINQNRERIVWTPVPPGTSWRPVTSPSDGRGRGGGSRHWTRRRTSTSTCCFSRLRPTPTSSGTSRTDPFVPGFPKRARPFSPAGRFSLCRGVDGGLVAIVVGPLPVVFPTALALPGKVGTGYQYGDVARRWTPCAYMKMKFARRYTQNAWMQPSLSNSKPIALGMTKQTIVTYVGQYVDCSFRRVPYAHMKRIFARTTARTVGPTRCPPVRGRLLQCRR